MGDDGVEPAVRERGTLPIGAVAVADDALDVLELGRVDLLDLRPVFSPGGVFHRRIRWDGRLQVIRARDGVHLSRAGSRIAAALIARRIAENRPLGDSR